MAVGLTLEATRKVYSSVDVKECICRSCPGCCRKGEDFRGCIGCAFPVPESEKLFCMFSCLATIPRNSG